MTTFNFDDLDEVLFQSPEPEIPLPVKGEVLFFDVETYPDWEAAEKLGIKRVEIPARTPIEDLPVPTTDGTEAEIRQRFSSICEPPSDWLEALTASETQSKKPRKGVLEFIADLGKGSPAHAALEEQVKELSTCPETCKIVALSMQTKIGKGNAWVTCTADSWTETQMLEQFWSWSKIQPSICGYNVLAFDLPVIKVRSIKLGVPPSRRFSDKPWENEVIDLMKRRFANSYSSSVKKLKDVCKAMSIEAPAGDCEGSQVFRLVEANQWKAIRAYVESDVEVTARLYDLYQGYFF